MAKTRNLKKYRRRTFRRKGRRGRSMKGGVFGISTRTPVYATIKTTKKIIPIKVVEALYFGTADKAREAVQKFLETDGDVNATSSYPEVRVSSDDTGMFGRLQSMVPSFSRKPPVDDDGNGIQNITLLMLACWKGYVDTATLLLDRGADINAKDSRQDRRGWTALRYAVFNAKVDIVNLLLDRHDEIPHDLEALKHLARGLVDRDGQGVVKNNHVLIATAFEQFIDEKQQQRASVGQVAGRVKTIHKKRRSSHKRRRKTRRRHRH